MYQNKVNFSLVSIYSPLLSNYTLGIILVREMKDFLDNVT